MGKEPLVIILLALGLFGFWYFEYVNPLITTIGTFDIDGYKVNLVNYCNEVDEGNQTLYRERSDTCLGLSNYNKNIQIVSNRHLSDIKSTCNHEMCHERKQEILSFVDGKDICYSSENDIICEKFIEMIK